MELTSIVLNYSLDKGHHARVLIEQQGCPMLVGVTRPITTVERDCVLAEALAYQEQHFQQGV